MPLPPCVPERSSFEIKQDRKVAGTAARAGRDTELRPALLLGLDHTERAPLQQHHLCVTQGGLKIPYR